MSTFKDNFTDFSLDSNAYAAFDATSLKELIIQRLTEQNVFTDHIFEGSNISAINDIIAYSYHVLLFYLNRTANEALFSEAQIYENMNRIVKLIDYKPIGYQTSTLTVNAKATDSLTKGSYSIPRYTFVIIDGIAYSFTKDIPFSKIADDEETIESIGDENLLFQGKYTEYPVQVANGTDFETIVMTTGDDQIEDSSIGVYVYDSQLSKYIEYQEVDSLYLKNPSDRVYEKRYNENGKYEIKFGNNVNGKKLNVGDDIYIFYLKSDGEEGKVQANALSNGNVILYSSPSFLNIWDDIKTTNTNYLSFNNISTILLSNLLPATDANDAENVGEIRRYAPLAFKNQNRLVVVDDFYNAIKRNFGNILTDVKVLDNDSYISSYLAYLQTIGLENPLLESRVLLNQVKFATSINFNNVYVIAVPRLDVSSSVNPVQFISTGQQELIKNMITPHKVIGAEVAFADPVYTAFDIAAPLGSTETLTEDIRNKSILEIEKDSNIIVDKDTLKQNVSNTITNYFKNSNSSLGQLVDLTQLSRDIISIDGVKSIKTVRSDNSSLKIEGLGFLSWNPVYPENDIQIINQNLQLDTFKFPYWYDVEGLFNKISIV